MSVPPLRVNCGVARAPTPAAMRLLAKAARTTLEDTMRWLDDLARAGPRSVTVTPTTQAYGDFLVSVAATREFGCALASTLPCTWGYYEVASRLATRGKPERPEYAAWIEFNASSAIAESVCEARSLLDQVAADSSPQTRSEMQRVFLTSVKHELAFWQMAWEQLSASPFL